MTARPAASAWLRATIFLGPVVAVLCTVPGPHPVAWWLVLVVAMLSLAASYAPDSPGPMVAALAVVAVWGQRVSDGLPVWVLVAGLALGASHLAAALAALGPRGASIDAVTLAVWLRRGAGLALASVLVWTVALLLRGRGGPTVLFSVALVVVLVLTVAASTALRAGPDEPDRAV